MKVDLGLDQLGRIVSVQYTGVVTIKDLENNWLEIIRQNIINANIKGFLLDYRNSIMNIDVEEIPILCDLFKKHVAIFEKKKFAYVTASPNQIILPLLLQEEEYYYESRPFSTTEAAISWVLN